jgi:hypothetical protein
VGKRYILSFTCQGVVDLGGRPWVKVSARWVR